MGDMTQGSNDREESSDRMIEDDADVRFWLRERLSPFIEKPWERKNLRAPSENERSLRQCSGRLKTTDSM